MIVKIITNCGVSLMEVAMLASGSLWIFSRIMGKTLASAWGVFLPCAALPLFALWQPGFELWRIIMAAALLVTPGMLFHPRLRHYILLPSCLVMSGGVAAMVMNFS